MGYHVKSMSAPNASVYLMAETDYQAWISGQTLSQRYYVAYSRLNTRSALLGQTTVNSPTQVRLCIMQDDGLAMTVQDNIAFMTGDCGVNCGTTHGFCTTSFGSVMAID